MAWRFRKSVKLGSGVKANLSKSGVSVSVGTRGLTTTLGKNGVYSNVGIPGTGLYNRQRIGTGSASKRTTSGYISRASSSGESVPKSVRDWQAYTGRQNPGVELFVNEYGEICFQDENGSEITDPSLISIIKRTPQYKAQLPLLKEQQRREAAKTVERMELDTASFTKIYTHSPNVLKRRYFEVQLQNLQLKHYDPKPYGVPAPTPTDIQVQLSVEAEQNVRGMPWNRRKLREEYFNAHYQEFFDAAQNRWQSDKDSFEDMEFAKAGKLNAKYQAEYDLSKLLLEKALEGDSEYIEAASEQWIASCKLPVDISVQFEYRDCNHCLMVDLDLPEIEDLPNQTAILKANGSLTIKDKTQKALRAEYAECVFGLAVFVASGVFNSSPKIDSVVISGYTQRRNKIGNLVNDYIYSIKFTREQFYCLDYRSMDPEAFCFAFENRCNLSMTKVFKTIKPFD